MGQLVAREKATERRERQGVLAVGQRVKDDLDAFVAVVMLVPRGGAIALGAQGSEAVAFGIKLAGVGLGLLGVQEVSILGHHQEDQAIDEAEKFVEPFGQVDLARFKLGGEVWVGLEEAGTENLERLLDLIGQFFARSLAFLRSCIAPAFQRAISGRAFRDAKAAAVDK